MTHTTCLALYVRCQFCLGHISFRLLICTRFIHLGFDATLGYPGEGPPRMHLQRRGTDAIGGDHKPLARALGGVNRLHAHATTDETALQHYVPAARKWLAWCRDLQVSLDTVEDKDRALSDYLAWLCYSEEKSLSSGTNVVNAISAIFVEMQHKLPESGRALQAWRRFEIQGEGAPIPWAGVGAISKWLSEQGEPSAIAASHLVCISADMYLRQSDWSLIMHEDVAESSKYGLAVSLGVPERGTATKTGTRQGVRPDFAGTEVLLLQYKRGTAPGEPLFPIQPPVFANWWRKALAALQYGEAGPPHTLRHVGPSHDVMTGYRTLDQVKNRGRWRAKTSVLRYAKSHTLIKAGGQLPPHLIRSGEDHLQAMGFSERSDKPKK